MINEIYGLVSEKEIDRLWEESAFSECGVAIDPQDRLYRFVDLLLKGSSDFEGILSRYG